MTRVAAQLAGNAIERIRAEMHLRETIERLNLAETVARFGIWESNFQKGTMTLSAGLALMMANNLDRPKIVQIWWTGLKYADDSQTDITLSWYHQQQNDFRLPSTCSPEAGFRASCAGHLNEVSLYADHHFTKRFDAYAGIAYSNVSGGLAIAIPHGPGVPYNYNNNLAPTVGARFTF
jgi:predicted porin